MKTLCPTTIISLFIKFVLIFKTQNFGKIYFVVFFFQHLGRFRNPRDAEDNRQMREFLRRCGKSSLIQPTGNSEQKTGKHLNELFRKKSFPISPLFLPFARQNHLDGAERDFIAAEPIALPSRKSPQKRSGPFGYAACKWFLDVR